MIREDQGAEGVEGRGMGRGHPSPFEWVWGSFVSSPAGSGAESRSKTVFDAFWSQKKPSKAPFLLKNWYAKRYGWRTSFKTATPVANWRTGSVVYVWKPIRTSQEKRLEQRHGRRSETMQCDWLCIRRSFDCLSHVKSSQWRNTAVAGDPLAHWPIYSFRRQCSSSHIVATKNPSTVKLFTCSMQWKL